MTYLLSLGIGLAVGVAYALLGVRSPAPPIVALLGLLGMLAGETAVTWLRGHPAALGWMGHAKTFHAAAPRPASAPEDRRA